MAQKIRERTIENINRVRNLISIYERIKNDEGEYNTDILRASVVLLHAALEDCIRSTSYSKLPASAPAELYKTEYKVPLGKIAEYRDKSINELIKDISFDYLERATYNNAKDISKALKSLTIEIGKFDLSQLDTAIARRHKIVHRADRGDNEGEAGRVTPIQAAHVLKWVDEVESFINIVLGSEDVST
jgi:hypothetical protein